MPPYEHEIYDEMLAVDDPYRASVFELPKDINTIFTAHGFRLYDFSDDSVLGGTKYEYIDVDHPTDKLDLRLLVYIAKRDQALRPYININAAESLLRNTKEDFFPR